MLVQWLGAHVTWQIGNQNITCDLNITGNIIEQSSLELQAREAFTGFIKHLSEPFIIRMQDLLNFIDEINFIHISL